MNFNRRKLIKCALIGGGVVVLGKILGPYIRGGSELEIGEDFGQDFKVIKKKDQLMFYNKKGEKVLTISQDGELEVGE